MSSKQVFEDIDQKKSLNPVLQSFQLVVNQYPIERDSIISFLGSMEMDIDTANYTDKEYKAYIHGSAEVIGADVPASFFVRTTKSCTSN